MPDLTKTRTELVAEAGGRLSASDSANSLSAEDQAAIDAYVDPLFARLAIDVIDLTAELEGDEIPVAYFTPLGAILANDAKSKFGRAGDQSLLGEAAMATATIYRLAAARATLETMRAEYF